MGESSEGIFKTRWRTWFCFQTLLMNEAEWFTTCRHVMENAVLEDVSNQLQTGRSDVNMDRNVEQQFRFSIYFRAKFVFCTQVCEQNLTLWGVAWVSRTLLKTGYGSWLFVMSLNWTSIHLWAMNVWFNPQLLLNIKINIHLSLKFITGNNLKPPTTPQICIRGRAMRFSFLRERR